MSWDTDYIKKLQYPGSDKINKFLKNYLLRMQIRYLIFPLSSRTFQRPCAGGSCFTGLVAHNVPLCH